MIIARARGGPGLVALVSLVLVALACALGSGPARAHEFRPALVQISEEPSPEGTRYAVRVVTPRVSTAGPMTPEDLRVVWPAHCERATRLLDCGARGLVGTLAVEGLDDHPIDVLVELRYLDGTRTAAVLSPDAPSMSLAGAAGAEALGVGREYFVLGVEHILAGIDHLLFVLGLVLLVGAREGQAVEASGGDPRRARQLGARLLGTITAFTLAHSVTLACATLELVELPGPPVEAGIALSILLLARELARVELGLDGARESLSFRYPWIVAFVFGLLHGFGFAGALAEVGLPPADVPLALLTFNLGVEAGQLAVVALVVVAIAAWRQLTARASLGAETRARVGAAPIWLMGALAFAWTVERVLGML